ncbi:histone-lysine N-methyltransferase Clr4 [Aspergillus candidus]|uniref:SET domain-containing protein n=1 Tax=Aspergillus candidus TaxID=41067 RepID=A0A2I2F1Y1_ASPCN|nr:SET domain-containing protein [Aspergillus candidus]PLB34640.1 SET domain-containing protein [Aspergillus candidus]
MVIDLTNDSDSEDQIQSQLRTEYATHGQASPSFTLAHRVVSPVVPQKRKPAVEQIPSLSKPTRALLNSVSLNGHVPSHSIPHRVQSHTTTTHAAHPDRQRLPSTPSPGLDPTTAPLPTVVVPSPSRHLKREIDRARVVQSTPHSTPPLSGLSDRFFPTNDYEKRARRGAYPVAKTHPVDRRSVPLLIGRTAPVLTAQRPRVADQLLRALQRKLATIKGPPVTFAAGNEHLLADFAANFEFINAYKIRPGVEPLKEEFIGGCGCSGFCDPTRCVCLETEEENSDRKLIAYGGAADDPLVLVLRPEILHRTVMIVECGARCNCEKACWNRVVQRGRTVRLEIFHTGERGFGLRSPDTIRAGQFIDCYLGEVITEEKADIREEIATAQHGHSYLFGLDFYPPSDETEGIYVVDGERFGGPARFMNHSCHPNCRMIPVSHTPGDERLYDLAFFAVRDIPPMTELTFDYNPGARESGRPTKIDPSAVRCLCGEKNCRGQLWPNQRKGTK